jgi:arylsulfatase
MAYAVGKLDVHPQRNRLGFDDVILSEEGRVQDGLVDDYEMYLAEQGLAGQYFTHGMSNNQYVTRPWHLAEEHHVTNWATREMVRTIKRCDPTRPALWYLSYVHPHPPLVPLEVYLDMYREMQIDMPAVGAWAADPDSLPYSLRKARAHGELMSDHQMRAARRAFYALCTHIDHQLRVIMGTLREHGMLDNTIILFSADHGDMLGKHGLWRKQVHYEESARVPMILLGVAGDSRVASDHADDRLVELQDVMPTLLDLAGIDIPSSVCGQSMVASPRRQHLFCEHGEGGYATRMVHDGRFKLIYYPTGNRLQLFDMVDDPEELADLSMSAEHAAHKGRMTEILISELYGSDLEFIQHGQLTGVADITYEPEAERGLRTQRGGHWPPPPSLHPDKPLPGCIDNQTKDIS